ncbi:MAG TPA: acyltransferase [Candidatus Saccharimonadales bacterium]|nr:acyltransferase [Candidatus Saccharimonadales bacterium]
MKKTYNPAIDVLRILAILSVVLIHTTTKTLEASSYDLQRLSWTLFLNQIFRFAVPLFFMISGFVLELNYPFHANYVTYLKKRLSRIIIPYIFWSFIYYFIVYQHHNPSFFSELVTGGASYQLYFIPALLIFYLIFPIIHRYYKVFANKWIVIFLGIIELFLLYKEYYIHPFPYASPLKVVLLNYFMFLLGILASHHQKTIVMFIQKWKIPMFLITVGLGSYVFFEGKNLYLKTSNYLSFYSQWRPSVFLYTFFLTGCLYFIFTKYQFFSSFIKTLSRLSLFVFFIHVLILEIVWNTFGKNLFSITSTHIAENLWYDPLFFIIIASLSFLAAYLVHKIPLIAKITS